MATAWNLFVKKIYHEGKKANPAFQFKDALKEASKRKGEMGSSGTMSSHKSKKSRKTRKTRKTRSRMGGKSRRHH